MALPPSYQPQGGPRSIALPAPDPNASGVGLANDFAQAGDQLFRSRMAHLDSEQRVTQIEHQTQLIKDQQQDLQEGATLAAGLAKLESDTRTYGAGQLATTTQPGAQGYTKSVSDYWDKGVDTLMAGVTSPRVRTRAIAQIAEPQARILGDAQLTELSAGITRMQGDAGTAVNTQAAMARADGLAGGKGDAMIGRLKELRTTVGNLPGGEDWQNKAYQEWSGTLVRSYVQGVTERNPDEAMAIARDPTFATILGPKVSDVLIGEAQAEKNRQAAAARAQEAAGRAVAKEGLATVKAQLDTGAGSPGDWEALAQGYEKVGDTSSAATARAKGTEMSATLQYRNLPLPQLDQQIADLQAIGATGKLSPKQASTLNGLKDLREQSAQRLNSPGGALKQYVFATGQSLTPLDITDPGAMRARAQLAAGASRSYGRFAVEPLTDAELPGLQAMMKGDTTQKLKALSMISEFGDPRAIEGAARQIAGNDDRGFRVAAAYYTLPGGQDAARDILRGPEALKANPKVWLDAPAKRIFGEYLTSAAGMPPDYAADRLEAAKDIYAARMTASGHTQWDEAEFRKAVEASNGSYVQNGITYGGTASFKGQRVILPPGWTGDGLFKRLARATPQDWNKAALTGTPMWPGGAPVTLDQIRDMVPVSVGGTRYALRLPSGNYLPSNKRDKFVFDAERVPWR